MVVSARLREMLARRQLEAAAVQIGEAFLGDWRATSAGLGGRDPGAGRTAGWCCDVMLPAARQRVRRARAALGWERDSMEARAVSGVVLGDRSCGEVAEAQGWAGPQVAMTALREGLRALVAVYGVEGERAA